MGAAGSTGATGATGSPGASFTFSGEPTTVDQNVHASDATCWFPEGIPTTSYTLSSSQTGIDGALVPESCSQIQAVAWVQVPPTAGTDSYFEIYQKSSSAFNRIPVCDFNPGAAGGASGTNTCSATVAVSFAVGDTIAACLRWSGSTSAPPHTFVKWTFVCTAP
jgi:hypothetical protein